MSDTAQDVQAREVETVEDGVVRRYRVSPLTVLRIHEDGDWSFARGSESAAIRRIAELEEERERYRKLLEDMPPTTWMDFNKRVKEALGSP